MALPSAWPSQQHAAYAGIGSRRTPPDSLDLMRRIGSVLATRGWVLRTGMAGGADQAFYRGASAHGALELYLPWPAFEAKARIAGGAEQFVLIQPTEAAHELAAQFHPAWSRLSRAVRSLHARNAHQVLGPDLASPARFVMCWTPDGSLDGQGRKVGGTGQALRIAYEHAIPVFNLARPEHAERVRCCAGDGSLCPAAVVPRALGRGRPPRERPSRLSHAARAGWSGSAPATGGSAL